MNLAHHFLEIKKLYFPRWDREELWRISTRSKRNVQGHCDPVRRVIEIVIQHDDLDERDQLLIHEICHAVAGGGHGKTWQSRMEKAAHKADEIGRPRLGDLLREEIVNYRTMGVGIEEAYQSIRDWVAHEPDITLMQVKRSMANQYGLLVTEVGAKFRRTEMVYRDAKRDALESKALKQQRLAKLQ